MDLVIEKEQSQLVCRVTRGSDVAGYLVIDSTVGGRSSGGLRMMADVNEAEVRALARAMTLKFGFLGLPQGGAKSGVRFDPEAPLRERRQRLTAFGHAIAPLLLSRAYCPGTDIGTDNGDIRHMLESVGVRVKRRELRGTESGYYTAVTVLAGAKEAVRHLGMELSGSSVAIEGFGKVGNPLAGLLDGANARVVAVSTSRGAIFNPQGLDVKRLQQLALQVGSRVVDLYREAERIDRAALLELPVDLLCPCARLETLHAGNADRVVARIICPGANNPITSEAESLLSARGVLCLPYFVTNCGGALGETMAFASVGKEKIVSFMEHHIGARIAWLLKEARKQHVSPSDIALPLALHRCHKIRQDASHPTRLRRLFSFGVDLHRRGWVPGALVGALSLPYFARTISSDQER